MNPRQPGPQPGALPTELHPPYKKFYITYHIYYFKKFIYFFYIQYEHLRVCHLIIFVIFQPYETNLKRILFKSRGIRYLIKPIKKFGKISEKMQHLYAMQVMHLYKIKGGYFIIDDTMQHHTNYCK